MLNRLLRLLGPTLLVAAAILTVGAASASAHAVLVDSSPRDGTRLKRMPSSITLRFDESVGATPDAGRVLDADGQRVDNAAVRSADDGRTVIIPIREGVGDDHARYLVSWRVISADSHVVNGSLRFGVGENADSVAGQSAPATDRGLAVVSAIGTGLGYAGLVAAVGCLAVGLLIWRSALRSHWMRFMIIGGSVLIVVGALVELVASGAELSATGWQGAARLADVGATVDSRPGRLLLIRIVVVVVVLPLALKLLGEIRRHRPERGWLIGWSLAACCLLVVVAAHGHAAVGSLWVIALVATVGHLAAMCCWVGGLLMLTVMIRPRLTTPAVAGHLMRPWSRLAFGCVAVLIISGELLGWRQVQPIEALWRTSYGVILLIKLGLIAVTLLAALLNQRLIGTATGLARTAATFAVELSIMVGVVAMATALSSTAPAVGTYGPPVTITRPMAGDAVRIRIDSTRRGPQTMAITVTDRSGAPVRLRKLSARLSSDDAGVSAIDVHVVRTADGWRSTDAVAPLPGNWRLQLTAGQADGPTYVIAADYRVW